MAKEILTLRCHPSMVRRGRGRRRAVPADFEPGFAGGHVDRIEWMVKDYARRGLDGRGSACVALSGGVDSALVAALARKAAPDVEIEAVSASFPGSVDETAAARAIAEHCGATHRILHVDNMLEEMPRAIRAVRMPFWDTHWYYVAKEAARTSKTLLTGDGGDEAFAGYTFRYERFLSRLSRSMGPAQKARLYMACHERDWVPDQKDLFGRRAGFEWGQIYSIVMPYFDNALPPIDQVLLADLNGKLLYNFAPVGRRIHKHFGIRAVAPLMNEELVWSATRLPSAVKYSRASNTGKLPLRHILRRHLKRGLMPQRKQGFSVDTATLWASHGRRLFDHYMDGSRTVRDGWISGDWIKRRLALTAGSAPDLRYVNKFLGLLALEVWYRIFVTEEMDGSEKLAA